YITLESMNSDETLINQVLEEDERRRRELEIPYDPVSGTMSPGTRFSITIPGLEPSAIHIPAAMQAEGAVKALMAGRSLTEVFPGSIENARQQWFQLRCRYDFPFWAYKCIKIKGKSGSLEDVPFLLNRPQRKLIGEFEKMREEGLPIRIILVKARQWGGSTATQIYMLWIQLMRRGGFNSLIIGQQNSGTEEVITMAKKALDHYPRSLLQGDGDPMADKEKTYVSSGLSRSVITIPRRNFRIKAGSAERPDACRGGDYALVHLTEVGLWKKTQGKRPEDIIRAATSGVLLYPETMIVMESTANGVGTFFHREYLAAKRGTSLYRPVFVAWHEIPKYSLPVADRRAMAERIVRNRNSAFSDDTRVATGEYIWRLWNDGASLDAINWYERARAGSDSPDLLPSEYPSNDQEAFLNSGANVFNRTKVMALRENCMPPRFSGELVARGDSGLSALEGITFEPDPNGRLKVWEMPSTEEGHSAGVYDRYLTVVDVGGRSMKADWSVIAVFDRIRMTCQEGPAIVAQWRGHCDMDQLAWLAARIARWYADSLLVIESNTLETRDPDRYVDGDQAAFILDQIRDCYPNLYARRQSPEDIVEGRPRKYGFHTNVSTKPMVISNLVKVVREGLYIERDERCLDELLTYERRPNGSFGAITGKHDDMLMTRAIGLHICFNEMLPPRSTTERPYSSPLRRTIQPALF
ncbi:MAG: terminase, partial [Muribaculaceae bacterium]|nr:terminase [Muribaculaceae bacterium]